MRVDTTMKLEEARHAIFTAVQLLHGLGYTPPMTDPDLPLCKRII